MIYSFAGGSWLHFGAGSHLYLETASLGERVSIGPWNGVFLSEFQGSELLFWGDLDPM